jgi:RNA polymerase sigma-70 factor (ECF subfamily)
MGKLKVGKFSAAKSNYMRYFSLFAALKTIEDAEIDMMPNITERQLIVAAQGGDKTALNELLTQHWQPMVQFVAYKVGNQQDAQDIAQETFLRAFRALPRYEERNATFRTYLGRIALNLIADHWRRLGRIPQSVDVADYRGLLEDSSYQPEELAVKSERQREVAVALAQLPQEQRRVVELRLLSGLSVHETAMKMMKTEAAIKMLQQRALANLRKLFQENKTGITGGETRDERATSTRRTLNRH